MKDEPTAVPDVDPVDELASAVVDGQASRTERAAAESDPAFVRRVAAFEAVARLVATPVEPAPDAAREAALAAALGAFDRGEVEPEAERAGPVIDLTERRTRAQRGLRWLPAVAAAALALAGIGVVVASGGDDDGATTAQVAVEADGSESTGTALAEEYGADDTASEEAAADSGDAAASGSGSGGLPAPTAGARAVLVAGDFGAFDDITDLASAVRSSMAGLVNGSDGGGESSNPQAPPDEAAPVPACPAAFQNAVELVGTATIAGVPVDVLVTRHPDGVQHLVAVDAASCEIVADLEL